MATDYQELYDKLTADFAQGEVKYRPGARGKQLPYIELQPGEERVVNVLRDAFALELSVIAYGFYESGKVAGLDSETTWVLAQATITLPDGRKVSHQDFGQSSTELTKKDIEAGMKPEDKIGDFKSAATDAFKRALTHFGIGGKYITEAAPTKPAKTTKPIKTVQSLLTPNEKKTWTNAYTASGYTQDEQRAWLKKKFNKLPDEITREDLREVIKWLETPRQQETPK